MVMEYMDSYEMFAILKDRASISTHKWLWTFHVQEFVRGDIWDSNLPVRMDGKLEMKLIRVGRKVRYTVRFSLTTAVFITHWMWLVASLSWESTTC